MSNKKAPAASIADLYGDTLEIHPRTHPHNEPGTDGVSLTFLVEDPDCDMLTYDLAGIIKVRDTLTRIIDAQIEGK